MAPRATLAAVRIEKVGNRIYLGSDGFIAGLKSEIPGAYFSSTKRLWSLPLDLVTCRLLREKYGSRLVLGPALTSWAKAEKAARETASAVAAAGDSELTILPVSEPALHTAMSRRTYQRAAARFIADSKGRDGRRRTLVGDTVGLGKTVEAIGGVLESGLSGPFLVVCPKGAVDLAWTPEIRRWLPGHEVITIPDGRAKRDIILTDLVARHNNWAREGVPQEPTSLARTWVIVHPAAVRTQTWWICQEKERDAAGAEVLCGYRTKFKSGIVQELDCGHNAKGRKTVHDHVFPQLFDVAWSAVVADESDQCLIRLTGTPNLQRRGMEMLRDLVPVGGARIAMSGTPFRSKPHQIWSTLNWLDPVRFSSKWSFIQRFWKTGGYSGYEILADGFMEDREAMLVDELSDIMIRRTREEVRSDLPDKLYPSNVPEDRAPGIYLPMGAKQARMYKEIERDGEARIEGGTLRPLGILAEITRMRQFANAPGRIGADGEFYPLAEGNKFDWLVDFLKELGFPDKPATKLVVASQFTKLLNAFAEGVSWEFKNKIQMGMITGEQTVPMRTATVNAFEDLDGALSLLFLNTKAGGSAITLDAAEAMVVLDETGVDDEQQQLEGRIDNRNPERRILPRSYYYLRSEDTIEVPLAERNAAARRSGNKLLNAKPMTAAEARMIVAIQSGKPRVFEGGKIRRCPVCGAIRNTFHDSTCRWYPEAL